MRTGLIACTAVLSVLRAAPTAPAGATLLEMNTPREALYTPGDVQIHLSVTQAARLEGPYRLRITASAAGQTIHERTTTLARGLWTPCRLTFPQVRTVTEIRCRAELFLDEEFVEAVEKPIRLWPPRRPCEGKDAPVCPGLWALDPSGVVQTLLSESRIPASDAAFQAVRDFGTPRTVVMGERLDPSAIRMILDRVETADQNAIVVLFRQEQLPESLQVSIAKDPGDPGAPVLERTGAPLDGLSSRDILGLLKGARPVRVAPRPGRTIVSFLSDATQSEGEISSYLCVIREGNHRILCCQLPATDSEDPRQMTLFHNLIRFACQAGDHERARP
jgi:hypothetical protein